MRSTATDTIAAVGGSPSGLTLRQVLEPGWDKICYVVFGVGVLMPLIGIAGEAWEVEEESRASQRAQRDKLFERTLDRDRRYRRRTDYPWGH